MASKRLPVLVFCGPTGSGKTALALAIAETFPVEIISADSRQVYRQMDIGTAKATAAERAVAPHHMIDLIDPDGEFSVADFIDQARPLIEQISARGKLPCVVGGTGLYIRALLGGLADLPSSDPQLRAELHRQEQSEGAGTLYRKLQQIDPAAAAEIHPNNLVRIVRALEVYTLSGKCLSAFKSEHRFSQQPYRVLKFAPAYSRDELYRRIDSRTRHMIAAGLVEEVEQLVARYSFDLKALRTLGYHEVVRYLRNEISGHDMVADIQKHTRHYAKRQLTWFRKETDIIWVDSLNKSGRVIQSIDNFLL